MHFCTRGKERMFSLEIHPRLQPLQSLLVLATNTDSSFPERDGNLGGFGVESTIHVGARSASFD